ncbi:MULTISPECIES: hypothetical protein [unclassified Frigoribacterium]|uniref:hypothetical protein n=1 Tax=unclassified Frigoribacterium TaxID=2627005 RepID=UPI000AEDDC43|nr:MULTISPECIES: hypothetical protein [unclassified Frigoribacterium]
MSNWRARRPKSRRLKTQLFVPLSITFVGVALTYITVYWVLITSGLAESTFEKAFERLQNLGQQVAIDSSALIAIAWPVVLSLVAAVFFVSRSSGPKRHSIERRIVALISIVVTGVVLSALLLSLVGSIGHQATANRLWLLVIATLFIGALACWLGNDALATRRRLRASARSDMRKFSRLVRRHRPAVGSTVQSAGWWLVLLPTVAVVLTVLAVTTLLACASGATFQQVARSLDALASYGRFALGSAVAAVVACALIATRSAVSTEANKRRLLGGAVITLLPSSLIPVLFALLQEDGPLVWAVRGALIVAGWAPLLLVAVPARSRWSIIWCARCVQMQAFAKAAHDARRDWAALRGRGMRKGARPRPLRTTPRQLREQ